MIIVIRQVAEPPSFTKRTADMNMIRRDSSVYNRPFGEWTSIFAHAAARLKRIQSARQSRAATRLLLTHDNRLLRDIGVSRADVEQALSVGWDQDPTAALAELRRRRMRADRQGALSR